MLFLAAHWVLFLALMVGCVVAAALNTLLFASSAVKGSARGIIGSLGLHVIFGLGYSVFGILTLIGVVIRVIQVAAHS